MDKNGKRGYQYVVYGLYIFPQKAVELSVGIWTMLTMCQVENW